MDKFLNSGIFDSLRTDAAGEPVGYIIIGVLIALGIFFLIALILWILECIGLSKLGKKNNISSPVLKAIFIPSYILGELGFEHYTNNKKTYMKWIMLACSLISTIAVSRVLTDELDLNYTLGQALNIINIFAFFNILNYKKDKGIGTVILLILGLGPIMLFAERNKIPAANATFNEEKEIDNTYKDYEEKEFKFCSGCGTKLPKEAKFCNHCGKDLSN